MPRPSPMAFVAAPAALAALALSLHPAPSQAEVERYRLRRGESIPEVVSRRYGDKYYLEVLEQHARGRLRGPELRLPTLRQILAAEGVAALAPEAVEKILLAQARFVRASGGNWPSCRTERAWQAQERDLLLKATQDLIGALGALERLRPAPRSMINQLRGAAGYLKQLPTTRGGPLCKAILGTHKRFVHGLRAAIVWARPPRR